MYLEQRLRIVTELAVCTTEDFRHSYSWVWDSGAVNAWHEMTWHEYSKCWKNNNFCFFILKKWHQNLMLASVIQSNCSYSVAVSRIIWNNQILWISEIYLQYNTSHNLNRARHYFNVSSDYVLVYSVQRSRYPKSLQELVCLWCLFLGCFFFLLLFFWHDLLRNRNHLFFNIKGAFPLHYIWTSLFHITHAHTYI